MAGPAMMRQSSRTLIPERICGFPEGDCSGEKGAGGDGH